MRNPPRSEGKPTNRPDWDHYPQPLPRPHYTTRSQRPTVSRNAHMLPTRPSMLRTGQRSITAKRAAATTRAGILLLGVALIAAAIAGAAVWINHRTLAETQQANREAQQR